MRIRRKRSVVDTEDYENNYTSPETDFKPNKTKFRWRFKPRSFLTITLWGIILFLGLKILLIPLFEGVYGYFVKTIELKELRLEYQNKQQKLLALKKTCDYMKTNNYVEKRGRELGFVKKNEKTPSDE